jgi:hypothetical protein
VGDLWERLEQILHLVFEGRDVLGIVPVGVLPVAHDLTEYLDAGLAEASHQVFVDRGHERSLGRLEGVVAQGDAHPLRVERLNPGNELGHILQHLVVDAHDSEGRAIERLRRLAGRGLPEHQTECQEDDESDNLHDPCLLSRAA